MAQVSRKGFGTTKNGEVASCFTLRNRHGMSVSILDYGATVQSIVVPDRRGVPIDVVLGYDDLSSYEKGACLYGAVVGRYVNRLGGASFTLDGKKYNLKKNNENKLHHIHGVFPFRMFQAEEKDGSLVLRYRSPDGEDGFPGNLDLEVTYILSEDNSLEIVYRASTDKPTILNLTNHSYFNLDGDGSDALDHKLKLNCDSFTKWDETFAQTGEVLPVEGTPFDFRKETRIGAHIEDEDPQLCLCGGYDHNMVLNGKAGDLKPIGTLRSEKSGILLEAFTTEPAIQLYSANFIHLDSSRGKGGVCYPRHGGVALEAQHYPDSMNHPNYPSVVLRPGENYFQRTIYRFLLSDKTSGK